MALHARRDDLMRELRQLAATRGVPDRVLEEIAAEAIAAVVMKPRTIENEEHLRRAFWLSTRMLLARYHEGRHRVRLGSRERVDFDAAVEHTAAYGRPTYDEVEFKDRLSRAADFMAQLDEFEAQVTALMAIRGVGIKFVARELDVPVARVKAAVHSAQGKLDQIAVIAAAGRMCGYRERAIAAHVAGEARADEVRAARAHLAACRGCRYSYARIVREMRRREFQRRASAAFLPVPLLAAGSHLGWAERLGAFVSAHLPASSSPVGGGGARERLLALVSGGAGAAKTAGVIAGAALVVAGATSGVSVLDAPNHHQMRHLRHMPAPTLRVAQGAVSSSGTSPSRDIAASGATATARPGLSDRPSDGGFSYLGGSSPNGSRTADASQAKPSPTIAKAASLQYLGASVSRASATAANASVASQPRSEVPDTGGQFSP